jgi:hypothetical protein
MFVPRICQSLSRFQLRPGDVVFGVKHITETRNRTLNEDRNCPEWFDDVQIRLSWGGYPWQVLGEQQSLSGVHPRVVK